MKRSNVSNPAVSAFSLHILFYLWPNRFHLYIFYQLHRVSTLSISLSIASVHSGHDQRFIQQAGLFENGKKMKNLEIINTAADCVELSVKRLPSGFGSVRYLGKGRCNPYAVHPPESSAKTTQSQSRRPPALCYVHSRETGIKILMIYHAGLYAPGVESDPDLLNRLYKKAIGQEDGEEVRKGVRISWKGMPGIMISPDIVAESNAFSLENNGNIQAGGTIPASKGIPSPGNPAGIPGVGYDYVPSAAGNGSSPLQETDSLSGNWNTDSFRADAVRPLSAPDPVWLQSVTKLGVGTGNLQNVPETGQAESVEDLYGRLYSLQAYINNLMEGIGRLKTNHSDLSREISGPSYPPMPLNTDSKPALSAGHTALHGLDNAPVLSSVHAPHQPGNAPNAPALSAVYAAFHQFKYGPQAAKQLSRSSRYVTAAAYKKLACFYDRSLDEISVMEWQELVNKTAASGHSRASVTDLVTLIRQLYRFALPRDMCTRDYGNYIVMPYTSEESHHQDFTDAELTILWQHEDDPVAAMILIMCYSGFRVGAFESLQVFLDQDGRSGYFCGGLKTKAGRNRIVPVHSAIMPLLSQILDSNGKPVFFCGKSSRRFREIMKHALVQFGIDNAPDRQTGGASDGKKGTRSGIYRKPHGEYRYHTPHSCRHTFSRLCESYGVNEADRRRMLGHSFGNDITNGVYGHRSVEELRAQIEKIKLPYE